jgi:UDP-N-acetyl-D-glucosamine dehydrogenase
VLSISLNYEAEFFVKLDLLEKLKNKDAHIGVIGMGYVGLPLMLRYNAVGYPVTGFDVDQTKVDKLYDGKTYIEHIDEDAIETAMKGGMAATIDFSKIKDMDAIILCVPTPLNKYREPDLSYVLNTLESILPYLSKGQVVSLESTSYPGTTEEELLPRIESQGFKVGQDVFLVYSPEREDPGNVDYTTHTIPKVVGGHTPECLAVGTALYEGVIETVVPVTSTKVAEMTKLLENIHRAVNIGLVNEMKIVADRMGVDIYEVIDAAATKPFGFTPYYPGPGLGGHCIPIDPFYLTWKAREYGVNTRFIELAGELNARMPDYVISKLNDGLNNQGKSLKDSRVLILGLAYKKNVDDERESPCIEILDKLIKAGALVDYSDPHIPKFKKKRNYNYDMKSVELSPEVLSSYDAVVLTTDHDRFDYDLIINHSKLIIDARGKYRGEKSNVIKA